MSYFLLGLLSAFWGASFLLISLAARGFDPLTFALLRVGVGALGLWLVAAPGGLKRPQGLGVRLALMSLFGQVLPFWLLGAAAHRIGSGEMAVLMGVQPIFAFVLTRALGEGSAWTPLAAVGLALGLAGVAIALGWPGTGDIVGRLECLLAALLYAFGATISRPASQKIGPAATGAMSMTISVAALGAVWVARGGGYAALAAASPKDYAAMIALGFFNTALAYWLYFLLVMREGATFASLNNYVVPFVGIALGATFLSEPVEPRALAGLALVICGVALIGRPKLVRRGGSGETRVSTRPS